MRSFRLLSIELVGGDRQVDFDQDFSIIRGSISSGKTTLIRLIRALLGSMPSNLPPEVGVVRSVRGIVAFDDEYWIIDRPLVETATATVQLARIEPPVEDLSSMSGQDLLSLATLEGLRLPAERATKTELLTYRSWILGKLGIPEVSVPRARSDASSQATAVTINDWLIYCIVRDSDLDTSVFRHSDTFLDRKRQAVFEINYQLYSEQLAQLQADLRSVELQLGTLENTNAVVSQFLIGTEIASLEEVDTRLAQNQTDLDELSSARRALGRDARRLTGAADLYDQIATLEGRVAEVRDETVSIDLNIKELADLRSSLQAQSKRLVRAIVADEWLVDFDFVVCPRCGTEVDPGRVPVDHCYLCLQQPEGAAQSDQLIAEQQRIASQIAETDELLEIRREEASSVRRTLAELQDKLGNRHAELDRRSEEFVSARSDEMIDQASRAAKLTAEIQQLRQMRLLFERFSDSEARRNELEVEQQRLTEAVADRKAEVDTDSELVQSLEQRFQTYLERLNISVSSLPTSGAINRRTYMPEVSGRKFDSLSSQGLSVLVNVAHALAHHTISIDKGLALPGLLVLDGLSNNVGHEGFDQDRLNDVYRLLIEETTNYEGRLQVIASDNDVPEFALESVAVELSTDDRLIRSGRSS